ncbi:MAG: hypothetical protein ACRCZD_00600, partial [Phycicoccus sp.]
MFDALGAGWVAAVPPIFGSAAASIERRRARLVGDPYGLRDVAAMWRSEANAQDAVWRTLESRSTARLSTWTGDSAEAASRRLTRFVGELSATAESLRHGATGLDHAAAALLATQSAANAHVLAYVAEVVRLYNRVVAEPPATRHLVLADVIRAADQAGGRTLQQVYAEEKRLDHVLASVPRSFVLGKASPWRRGIMQAVEDLVGHSFGSAVTLRGIRGRRSSGISISRDTSGRHTVTLTDDYGLGIKLNSGAKIDLDRLSEADQAMLRRVYSEAEGGGVATYTLRYHFASRAEAEAFVDRLDPKNPWDRAVAVLQDGVGGPLRRVPDDRRADEGVIS